MLPRFVVIVSIPLLASAVGVTPQLVTATQSTARTASEAQPAAAIELFPPAGGAELNEDEATDVYGNEVTAAVATYKFDATGSLYELHSPQTEIPRLASPKS